MKRTSLASGIILPALLALTPGCDDPFVCPGQHIDCGQICVDLAADDLNCGACGTVCPSGESCVASACVPDAVVCTAPEVDCSGTCADLQTSSQHCGACGDACSTYGDCTAGDCAEPLAAIQTVFETKGTYARDLYVLQDLTFALTRLNPQVTQMRVIDHAVLPDRRVLLVAAFAEENRFSLWLATPDGSTLPTEVNGPLTAGGDVLPGIVVSRDGSRVLYRADQDTDDVIDLYAVDLASPGDSRKVNGTLVAGGEVSRVFAVSSDGRRATYIADQDTDDHDELYTVDLTAAAPPVKLNPVTSEPIWDFKMTDGGGRVVYRTANPQVGRIELRVVATNAPGVAPVIVHADGAEGQVDAYQLSPDSTAVFFTAGRGYLNESLWRAPLAPLAEATRLVDGSANNEWVRDDFQINPDGTEVVFRKVSGAFGFDRLFRVAVATPLQIQQLSPSGDSSAEEVTDFVLADNGTSVVYRGGADGAEGGNYQPGTEEPFPDERRAPAIYHLDLGAAPQPTPTLLSGELPLGAEGIAGGYIVAGDGTRVIYRADHDTTFITEAYLVALATAGTMRKVSPPLGGVDQDSDVSRLTRF